MASLFRMLSDAHQDHTHTRPTHPHHPQNTPNTPNTDRPHPQTPKKHPQRTEHTNTHTETPPHHKTTHRERQSTHRPTPPTDREHHKTPPQKPKIDTTRHQDHTPYTDTQTTPRLKIDPFLSLIRPYNDTRHHTPTQKRHQEQTFCAPCTTEHSFCCIL